MVLVQDVVFILLPGPQVIDLLISGTDTWINLEVLPEHMRHADTGGNGPWS